MDNDKDAVISAHHPIVISTMRKIYFSKKHQSNRLSMAEITDVVEFSTFAEFRDHLITDLRYPRQTTDKAEAYGWVPTVFNPSTQLITTERGTWERHGFHRDGDFEVDDVSVFVADVDNGTKDRDMVEMIDVADRLDGLSYAIYSSHSHTCERHKFRVVIEIDRDIGRAELRRLFLYFNRHVLAGQGDASIYDPADFLFAPPYQSTIISGDGSPLPVDDVLRDGIADLTYADRKWLDDSATVRNQVFMPLEGKSLEEAKRRIADKTIRPRISINNPMVCKPEWIAEYAATSINGSHWETMRSLLGRLWQKNSASLSYGEMDALFDEIDMTDGGYFLRKHGHERKRDLISWVMQQPTTAIVSPQGAPPRINGNQPDIRRPQLQAESLADLFKAT